MNAKPLRVVAAVVSRDLLVVKRHRARLGLTAMIALAVSMVLMVFMGLYMDSGMAWRILPPLLWSVAVTTGVVTYAVLLDADACDGALDQMLIAGQPHPIVVAAKACSHWLLSGFPILLLAAVGGAGLAMPGAAQTELLLCLLVGSSAQSISGAAIVASATMSAGVDAHSHQRRLIGYLAIMALTVATVAPPKTVSSLVFAFAALGAAQTIMLHLASRLTARARFRTHG